MLKNYLKILFHKRSAHSLSFVKKFQYFQSLLKANDEVHKRMSDLGEIIASGKHFSKGRASKIFYELIEITNFIIKQLILLSNGKYEALLIKFGGINDICNKIITPGVICNKQWDCRDIDCQSCNNKEIVPINKNHYYLLKDIDDSYEQEVGSKMSHLGEITNKLNIPVPNGFCLTINLFEEIMLNGNLRERKNKIFYDIDFENIKEVRNASRTAQEIINSEPLPDNVCNVILDAFDETFGTYNDKKVAVRSSAIGEDSKRHSFAGLHLSELNVSRNNLIDACMEVLISKYSPESIFYRYYNGLRDEDMPMCIGVIEMIDAKAGGVLFSSGYNEFKDFIMIQAVHGLGLSVVKGTVEPQQFIVSRSNEPQVLKFKPGKQIYINMPHKNDGIGQEKINSDLINMPCLNDEQIKELTGYALKIEKHYHSPQDIEWILDKNDKILIIQTRPITIEDDGLSSIKEIINIEEIDSKYKSIINSGDCASTGIGYGKAFLINSLRDIDNLPNDSIVVANKNIPEIAGILHKVSGLITDAGSTIGHLSIIARELGIPFITNTGNSTQLIKNGDDLTLYANEKKVYPGLIPELIDMKNSIIKNAEFFRNTTLYRIFHRLSKFIFPLYLTKPNGQNFAPEYCQTIHDVIRFAHEMAMQEMFTLYENPGLQRSDIYKLKFDVPLDVTIIDLGEGIKPGNYKNVTPEELQSEPFISLIKGMTTPGINWGGPLAVDFKGFMNVVYTNISDSSKADRNIGSKSYALISKDYLNFFSRLGYHFSRLDALAGDEVNLNYLNFHFRGGAADITRRGRRAIAIKNILEYYNFNVVRTDDNVIANIRKVQRETILELLFVLGKLMGAVRNTDVTMIADNYVEQFVKYFLEGDPAPALRFK